MSHPIWSLFKDGDLLANGIVVMNLDLIIILSLEIWVIQSLEGVGLRLWAVARLRKLTTVIVLPYFPLNTYYEIVFLEKLFSRNSMFIWSPFLSSTLQSE